MSTQLTPQHCAERHDRSTSNPLDRFRIVVLGVLLFALFGAAGCSESGGSSSGSGSGGGGVARPASAPIDLEPGQTSVRLHWAPSRGAVDGYRVFESRNGQSYVQTDFVRVPHFDLSGTPGDSVRVLAIAQGTNGSQSTASPPSPPIRFHGVAQTASIATAAILSTSSTSTTSTAVAISPTESTEDVASSSAPSDEASPAGEETSEAEPSGPPPLDPALRRQILRADARLPIRDHGPNASAWIQSIVDEQVAAGVILVGVGERTGDGRRELIWSDPNGQLFVSEGAALESTDDVPSTFDEALRLRSTERFVALADFDADGLGEWLIEDAATGEVWIAESATGEAAFVAVTGRAPGDRVLGEGDFDGDGRAEILWQRTDLSLAIGRPDARLPELVWQVETGAGSEAPAIDATDLLGVADVNGDGRDDLLFLDGDGNLEFGMAGDASTGVAFTWQSGPEGDTRGLEILATLDFDGDGAADVAWWSEVGVQLWALYDTP